MTGTAAGYATYAAELRVLVALGASLEPEDALPHLDGYAAVALRRDVPLASRRTIGAFFTSSVLRAHVRDSIIAYRYGPPFLDPACGAGDLLLAVSETLPTGSSARATSRAWSTALRGWDTEAHFTDVARSRLRLSAAVATTAAVRPGQTIGGRDHDGTDAPDFTLVRVGDALERLSRLSMFTGTVVLNPPFGAVQADRGCRWGEGLVPRAAVFTEAAVKALAPGSGFVAILPDVLRSGSRLARWRAVIGEHLDVDAVRSLGQFDAHTDIDVFLLAGRRGRACGPRASRTVRTREESTSLAASGDGWPAELDRFPGRKLGDLFEVRVGSVVDNRDPHTGPWRPFATARSLPVSGRVDALTKRRRFSGTVRTPPFVIVRRTNRPTQGRARALGVLVTGSKPVAVDNHLLVAIPKDGRIETCEMLLNTLMSPDTGKFLDERMRCRHLTVSALSEVPLGAHGDISTS